MRFAKGVITSFLDYPGSIASVVFTVGCNFRCPYCHNPDLVLECVRTVDEQEVLQEIFKRKITQRVVISGGEPTIHRELPNFVVALKEKGYLVKLDTNGSNPELIEELLRENLLDYVALDIKSSPERFGRISGLNEHTAQRIFERILRTLELLRNGTVQYEVRTTFVPGLMDEMDLMEIKKIIGDSPWYVQRFRPNKTLFPIFQRDLGSIEIELEKLVVNFGAKLR